MTGICPCPHAVFLAQVFLSLNCILDLLQDIQVLSLSLKKHLHCSPSALTCPSSSVRGRGYF